MIEQPTQTPVIQSGNIVVPYLIEAWGDLVDPRDRSFGFSEQAARVDTFDALTSNPSDRRFGHNPPHWRSEQEHSHLRAISRYLAAIDSTSIGILENLANYVVGWGGAYSFNSIDKDDKAIAKAAEKIWESIVDAEDLDDVRDREYFKREVRDGEAAERVYIFNGSIRVETIEPEWIVQPSSSRDIEDYAQLDPSCWTYGVQTEIDRASRWHGVFASYHGSATDWDYIPKRELVFTRSNIDSGIKRGASDFLPVWQEIEKAGKLLDYTVTGGTMQAAIAYIREHAPGTTRSSIEDRPTTGTRTVAGESGSTTVKTMRVRKGTIVDTTNQKYSPSPVGAGYGGSFIEICQAVLRRSGTRWQMPEYMISGDASNANYSSTMVAESPFVKAAEARQRTFRKSRKELVWKVLSAACSLGMLRGYGIETAADLRTRIEVDYIPATVAVRNRLEDAQVLEIEKRNGVTSVRTWQEEISRDPEEEAKRGAAMEATLDAIRSPVPTTDPIADPAPLPTKSAAESGVEVVGGEVIKPQESALNGAQVQAAVGIVGSVARGELPRDAAIGQLRVMFNLGQAEAEAILGSVGKGFVIQPTPTDAPAVSTEQLTEAVLQAAKRSWIDYP